MITQTVTVALGCFQAHWRLLLTVHLILALPSFLYGRLKLVGIVPDIYEFGDHIALRPDTSLLGENILMFFMQDFLWDQVGGAHHKRHLRHSDCAKIRHILCRASRISP